MTKKTPSVLGTLESALYADDLEAAKDFWQDVMGLQAFQTVPDRHVFFYISENPPQILLIFRAAETKKKPKPDARLPVPPHGTRGHGHFCLAVAPETLDAWCDHLKAKGVQIEADFNWPNGARSIYFRDPAGNSIELADPAIWS